MTSAELHRIVGAMTERPWRWTRDSRCVAPERTVNQFTYEPCDPNDPDAEQLCEMVIETDGGHYPPYEADRAAIITLANHADAFVRLVEACERWAFAADGFGVRNLQDALAAVHAVRGEP